MSKSKNARKKNKSRLPETARPVETQGDFFRPDAWAFLNDLSGSRPVFWICALLLPVAVIAYYPGSESLRGDYDVWFHLAYGKHYVQNLTWHIDHSLYSWTPARSDAMYVTWLGSSFIYLVHAASGVPGLFVLSMLLLAASSVIIIRFAQKSGIRSGLGLLAGLLLVAVTVRIGAHHVKPEMFSIFMFTLLVAFYLRFRMAPGAWIMAALPGLFLFWVNTHGLWIFGAIFFGFVFGVDLFLYFVRRAQALDHRHLIYLSYAVGLTLVALCINPFGPYYPAGTLMDMIRPLFSAFFSLEDSAGLSHYHAIKAVTAYQSMWSHLFFVEPRGVFLSVSAWAMLLMLVSFLYAWGATWRRTGQADLPVAAANIVFFFLGMVMGRLLLLFPLLWILSLVFFVWRARPDPLFARTGPVCFVLFLLLTGYTGFVAASVYAAPSWFGARYRDYVPDTESRYIMINNLPGPIFNDYLSGGYLMWAAFPKYKVFLDPRQFPHLDEVFPDYDGIGTTFPLNDAGFQAFMAKYPARVALIHYSSPHLIHWFQRSPDWTLVYFDRAAVVMIRRDILPTLNREARAAMRSPEKYMDLDNPILLSHLFNIYNSFLGPQYAGRILDIYEKNVSDLFWFKKSELAGMRKLLNSSTSSAP